MLGRATYNKVQYDLFTTRWLYMSRLVNTYHIQQNIQGRTLLCLEWKHGYSLKKFHGSMLVIDRAIIRGKRFIVEWKTKKVFSLERFDVYDICSELLIPIINLSTISYNQNINSYTRCYKSFEFKTYILITFQCDGSYILYFKIVEYFIYI